MGQDVIAPPSVNIDNVTLDVVDQFIYLGSTITSNLSLDAFVVSKLNKRVWSKTNLTEKHQIICLPDMCP